MRREEDKAAVDARDAGGSIPGIPFEVVAILESMKLEISIKAMVSGVAKNISISRGAMVDRGQPIVEITPLESESS